MYARRHQHAHATAGPARCGGGARSRVVLTQPPREIGVYSGRAPASRDCVHSVSGCRRGASGTRAAPRGHWQQAGAVRCGCEQGRQAVAMAGVRVHDRCLTGRPLPARGRPTGGFHGVARLPCRLPVARVHAPLACLPAPPLPHPHHHHHHPPPAVPTPPTPPASLLR